MVKLFVNTPGTSIFDTDSLSCGSIANLSPPLLLLSKLSTANHKEGNIGCDVMIVCVSVSWKTFVTRSNNGTIKAYSKRICTVDVYINFLI